MIFKNNETNIYIYMYLCIFFLCFEYIVDYVDKFFFNFFILNVQFYILIFYIG